MKLPTALLDAEMAKIAARRESPRVNVLNLQICRKPRLDRKGWRS